MMLKVTDWVETLWEKEKMLVNSIFSLSHNVFKRLSFPGSLQGGIVWSSVNCLNAIRLGFVYRYNDRAAEVHVC